MVVQGRKCVQSIGRFFYFWRDVAWRGPSDWSLCLQPTGAWLCRHRRNRHYRIRLSRDFILPKANIQLVATAQNAIIPGHPQGETYMVASRSKPEAQYWP